MTAACGVWSASLTGRVRPVGRAGTAPKSTRVALLVFIALGTLAPHALAAPQAAGSAVVKADLHSAMLGSACKFDAMKFLAAPGDTSQKFVYGDSRGVLHVLAPSRNGFKEEWASSGLRSAIGEVFVEDLDDDSRVDILCYTVGGRMYVLDSETYRIVWQNMDGEYSSITCMAVANVDSDPQKELLFLADGKLRVYDGKSRFEEWKSDQDYGQGSSPLDILVADVDGDGLNEICLSSGWVLDSRFFDVEWQSPDVFGNKLGAMDIDGDGILELIGESDGRTVRVFDVDLRKEKL